MRHHGNSQRYVGPVRAVKGTLLLGHEDSLKIATYSRVSRNDGTQDASNQADELRAWAQRLGGQIVREYTDTVSGTKSAEARPGLAQALLREVLRIQDPGALAFITLLPRRSKQSCTTATDVLAATQSRFLFPVSNDTEVAPASPVAVRFFEVSKCSQRIAEPRDRRPPGCRGRWRG